MADRPCLVVDASVAVKWHLSDEEFAEVAVAVLADFREDRVNLLAPDHIRYEVANAIRVAARRGRLTPRQGREALEQFLSWGLWTVATDQLFLAAYDTSERLGCALYDGLYLALAESADCPLIYADRVLRNHIRDQFPLALWIGDYSPPQTG